MKSNQIKTIKLTEIDPTAITTANLREVTEDDKFKFLCDQIKNEGQRNPIVIRKLRKNESTQPETKYGILDGHHRYSALLSLNFETANCIEVESDNDTEDLIKAAAYNLSHKNLEMWEIGKILVELQERTKEKLEVVAQRFNIARSTAFKYKKEYSKHMSPASKTEKPPKILAKYDYKTLTDYIQKLSQKPGTSTECQNHLDQINHIEALLSDYKKKLKAQLKDFKKLTGKNTTTADNLKNEVDAVTSEKTYNLEEIVNMRTTENKN